LRLVAFFFVALRLVAFFLARFFTAMTHLLSIRLGKRDNAHQRATTQRSNALKLLGKSGSEQVVEGWE
jgi:hypothetical protein